VRRKVGELRFALGVQLIEGATDPLVIAAALSRIADATIQVLADATIAEFEQQHGRIPGSELVILGLGRMGGGALTHASDLDLVYLFSGDFGGASDGSKPLGATLYFNRLAQRITAALSVPTAEGALYQVDTRLRPSGTHGPLAVSFASFALYQMEQAWTWEHMALCRGRAIYGSEQAVIALVKTITDVLRNPRSSGKLRADVLEMRGDIAQHKPPAGPLDVKLARGGLVDLEFLTHYLQLRDGVALMPNLGDALREVSEQRLIPDSLLVAHDLLTRLLVAMRLLAPDSQIPSPAARDVLAKACGTDDWRTLLAALKVARKEVADAWHIVFGEKIALGEL
jgi:[glutamine synthetase] adenylyltransferase / [glutamine synthetase]-adenylyl-L-tyrosine phosphorylase